MRKPNTKQINFIPASDVRKFLSKQENKTETINDAVRYLMRSSCEHRVTTKAIQETCVNCGEVTAFYEYSHKEKQ